LRIEDGWLAYQVDVAALLLGVQVEGATADGKKTAAQALAELGGRGAEDLMGRGADGRQWRDARPFVSRVVRIREDGSWDD
jgi:hypothetical protein